MCVQLETKRHHHYSSKCILKRDNRKAVETELSTTTHPILFHVCLFLTLPITLPVLKNDHAQAMRDVEAAVHALHAVARAQAPSTTTTAATPDDAAGGQLATAATLPAFLVVRDIKLRSPAMQAVRRHSSHSY